MAKGSKTAPKVSLDRVTAILARDPPATYVSTGGNGQRARRSPVYKQGVAVLSHGEKLPVVIKNLSATGCRIEYFQAAHLEGRILILEPSVPLRQWGDVVWQGDGASGIAFVEDTPPAE
jgi:hypothetical protein